MVEVMLGLAEVAVRKRDGGHLLDGDQLSGLPGDQVEVVQAAVGRSQDVVVGVGDTGITVAGSHVVDPPEVGADGRSPIGGHRVDRVAQSAPFAAVDVEDMGDEVVAISIVPDDLVGGTWNPLEHAALLPTPGAGLS